MPDEGKDPPPSVEDPVQKELEAKEREIIDLKVPILAITVF